MKSLIKIISICAVAFSFTAHAQDGGTRIGRETHLPIPRYVSLNSFEANMRHGPSLDYPIDWVYNLRGLPLRIIGESGHWRKVEDFEGVKGWLHYALLSGNRNILVTAEKTAVNKDASQNSRVVAILQKNVVAKVDQCVIDWCEVEVEDSKGWVEKKDIWGVDADEVFE